MDLKDILGGGQYGEIAGALLARKRKQDRRGFQDALKASVALNFFGNLKANQEQNWLEDRNEVVAEFEQLKKHNKGLYDKREEDRLALEQYNKGGLEQEAYLNDYAKSMFNKSDFVMNRPGLSFDNRGDYGDPELKKEINAVLQQIKDAEIERLQKLKNDPLATSKTFEEFNEPLLKEFEAKLRVLDNDPTKKSFFKKALNKIFGYGAAEISELNTAANDLEKRRKNRDKLIDYAQSSTASQYQDATYENIVDDQNIDKYFRKTGWDPDADKINSESVMISSRLANGGYEELVVDVFNKDGNESKKTKVLAKDRFGQGTILTGAIDIRNLDDTVRENVRPEVAIAKDVATMTDYLMYVQEVRAEELKKTRPDLDYPRYTREELDAESLRLLAKSGRFVDFGVTGGGYAYYPIQTPEGLQNMGAAAREEFNKKNPILEYIKAEEQVKTKAKAPRLEEVVYDMLDNQRDSLVQEYRGLISKEIYSDSDKARILELEGEIDKVTQGLSRGNDQAFNRAFLELVLSDNPPVNSVIMKDENGREVVTSLGDFNQKQKELFYNRYLKQFNIERDEELERLLGY